MIRDIDATSHEMMEALVWFCTITRLFDVNASPLTIVIARGTYVAVSARCVIYVCEITMRIQ